MRKVQLAFCVAASRVYSFSAGAFAYTQRNSNTMICGAGNNVREYCIVAYSPEVVYYQLIGDNDIRIVTLLTILLPMNARTKLG